MSDPSKLLDTLIKAPLWFFFAAMLAASIPMFRIPNLIAVGVTAEIKIGGIPLALIALLFTALFISSAVARLFPKAFQAMSILREKTSWQLKLSSLPKDAKIVMGIIEDDAVEHFYYDPRAVEIKALRDQDFIIAELVGEGGVRWGRYTQAWGYKRAYKKRPGLFRRALQYDDAMASGVRAKIAAASKAASRRI